MKIVLYNTRSDAFNGDYVHTSYYPRRAAAWDELAAMYPEHEIVVVAKKPGNGLFDMDGNEVSERPERVPYVFIEDGMDMDAITDLIAAQEPDVAIAVSTAGLSLDWNPILDALIAEELQKRGIRTEAHTVFTAIGSFDKWRSSMMLRHGNFGVAKSLYIHNDMFWVENEIPSLTTNVYKDYILHRMKDMRFPVIIKSTTGAGSAGVQVAADYESAKNALLSQNNNADLIVEELMQGEQFGTEIHSDGNGKHHVLPPFAFSINDEGITDPYTSVKFGPVTGEDRQISELQESLKRMAEEFGFKGITEIDLVYRDGQWYIIEINPRWSGLTTTAAACERRHPWAIYMDAVLGSDKDYSDPANLGYVVNFKIPEVPEEELRRLSEYPGVQHVGSTIADAPGRDRLGFCEVVFGGFDTREELIEAFNKLRREFPGTVTDSAAASLEALFETY